jgi:hypothetical protein
MSGDGEAEVMQQFGKGLHNTQVVMTLLWN